jgi:hypothetical protein
MQESNLIARVSNQLVFGNCGEFEHGLGLNPLGGFRILLGLISLESLFCRTI